MWRLRIFMLIGGIAARVFGGQKTYTSLTNSSPTSMSYAQFCSQRPDAKWLELTEGWVDFRGSCEIDTINQKTKAVQKREYYVPVFQGKDSEPDVVAFLKCNDAASIALASEGAEKSQLADEAWDTWSAQNLGRMRVKRTVKGLVRHGLDSSEEDRNLLKKAAGGHLDTNFIIIEENEEPQGGLGFLLLLLGVGLIGGAVASLFIGPGAAQPQPTDFRPQPRIQPNNPQQGPRPGNPLQRPGPINPALRPDAAPKPSGNSPPGM